MVLQLRRDQGKTERKNKVNRHKQQKINRKTNNHVKERSYRMRSVTGMAGLVDKPLFECTLLPLELSELFVLPVRLLLLLNLSPILDDDDEYCDEEEDCEEVDRSR